MATLTVNLDTMTEAGENIQAAIVDGKMVLVIDLSVDLGPSSTGKMRGIASTGGFTAFPKGLKGNIYIGKKA